MSADLASKDGDGMVSGGSGQAEYPDRWSPQRRAALAVFLWPLLVAAVGALCYLSFIDQLPAQIAIHWGGGGPDGFTARESAPWLVLIGLFTAWALGALILAIGGKEGMHRRLGVGLATGTSVFMTGVMAGTAWVQRGLADGADASDAQWPLVLALIASLVVGSAAAFTVPGNPPAAARASGKVPESAVRTREPVDASAIWHATARPTRTYWLILAALTLGLFATAVLTQLWVFVLVMFLVSAGLMVVLSFFQVTISAEGLVVRSVLGVPTWRLPLDEVAEARVVTVSPFAEFGGWGYRLGPHGRTGFVTRTGEAIEVERGDGTSWVLTVDDAGEGAALLNSLADRGR